MRATLVSMALLASLAACGARTVSVESAPATAPSITLTVTNGLTQAVNVYVVSGSTDRFVQQVAAKSTASLAVAGLPAGAIVQLKATTADGTKTYTKDGVTLQSSNMWTVP